MLHKKLPEWLKYILAALLLVGAAIMLKSSPIMYQPKKKTVTEPVPTFSPTASPKTLATPSPTPEPTPTPFAVPEVHPYTDPVNKGQIRYVSQLVDDNGWGKYAWKAGNECTTACISMAMSYLGIDASPESILSYNSKTILSSSYGMEENVLPSSLTEAAIKKEDRFSVFSEMFELYTTQDEIKFSPVLVYLQGLGHYHAIIIIGKDSDGYLCVDPTPLGIHHVSINEDGTITTDEEGYLKRYISSDSPATINSLAQWELKCSEVPEKSSKNVPNENISPSETSSAK